VVDFLEPARFWCRLFLLFLVIQMPAFCNYKLSVGFIESELVSGAQLT